MFTRAIDLPIRMCNCDAFNVFNEIKNEHDAEAEIRFVRAITGYGRVHRRCDQIINDELGTTDSRRVIKS